MSLAKQVKIPDRGGRYTAMPPIRKIVVLSLSIAPIKANQLSTGERRSLSDSLRTKFLLVKPSGPHSICESCQRPVAVRWYLTPDRSCTPVLFQVSRACTSTSSGRVVFSLDGPVIVLREPDRMDQVLARFFPPESAVECRSM
jgi:hypothetical protein